MELENLKKQIAELEAYRAKIERQQIKFPIDYSSERTITKLMPVPTGLPDITPTGLIPSPYKKLEVIINGEKRYIMIGGKY